MPSLSIHPSVHPFVHPPLHHLLNFGSRLGCDTRLCVPLGCVCVCVCVCVCFWHKNQHGRSLPGPSVTGQSLPSFSPIPPPQPRRHCAPRLPFSLLPPSMLPIICSVAVTSGCVPEAWGEIDRQLRAGEGGRKEINKKTEEKKKRKEKQTPVPPLSSLFPFSRLFLLLPSPSHGPDGHINLDPLVYPHEEKRDTAVCRHQRAFCSTPLPVPPPNKSKRPRPGGAPLGSESG
ncbi:uncharacterized protein LY79DRAFT_269888 [Colletotrichum navitas]|uniref:Uncharacterized protein n=1 Tax=Colletotrichum navitas TaxID=681940 RepID=A0AAD8PWJ6_9PEZI|nr:uncharacterized protein LY79DRAFT_269888 [Colletotrichum navitas]KAK1585314.1 hypothetical protein LY79DRAFT_269888 [Colletotrichum navitas]